MSVPLPPDTTPSNAQPSSSSAVPRPAPPATAELAPPPASSSTGPAVIVDAAHPFDLAAYAAQFDGRPLLLRLTHIALASPSLFPACASLALPVLKTHTLDLALFDFFGGEPDDPWRAAAREQKDEEHERLEAELKSVSANLLKESIRITHLDLAAHHLRAGEPHTALKHLLRTREFTSSAAGVLDGSLRVIEVNVELRAWAQLAPYIVKADSALDRPAPTAGSQASSSVPLSAAQERAREAEAQRREKERSEVGVKLGVARGLGAVGQGNWERGARELLGVDVAKLREWGRTILSPAELAILSALTALATLRRSALQSEVLASDAFRAAADEAPHARALVEAFVEGRYKTVLELLERHSAQHQLLPYLAPHLANLTLSVRRRALLQYLVPFTSVSLPSAALAFGLPLAVIAAEVEDLVRTGEVGARVDKVGGVLRRRDDVVREKTFADALDRGEKAERATRRAVIRMQLVEQGLVLSDPNRKSKGGAGGADDPFIVAEEFE